MSFDNDLKVPADMQINDYSICAFIVPVFVGPKSALSEDLVYFDWG